MTITILFPSGAVEVCDMIDGHLRRKTYYGYTRKEAKEMFTEEFKPKKKGSHD